MDSVRTTLTLAFVLAAVLAAASVAGYAVVTHDVAPTSAAAGNVGTVGTLDVLIRDTPAPDWSHVYVTFDQIAVHPPDAGNASDWQPTNVRQRTVDLTSTRSLAAPIGSTTLKAGTYTQLRIVVESAQGVVTNGTKVNFTVPSGELKTADAFHITTGQTTSLTINVDLSLSIVEAGNTWILAPVPGSVQTS